MTTRDDTRPEEGHPLFAVAAKRMVRFAGSGWAIAVALAVVASWVAIGFALDFPRPWELAMTAGLPVLSLLLLIVVQHTQNHDNLAMQLKLDELIRALEGSQEGMIRVEDASGEHLESLERDFKAHVSDTDDRRGAA